MCRVLITSPQNAAVHNCLVEFEDGYRMITSKWNLFQEGNSKSIPLKAVLEFMKSGFNIECNDGKNLKFIYSGDGSAE